MALSAPSIEKLTNITPPILSTLARSTVGVHLSIFLIIFLTDIVGLPVGRTYSWQWSSPSLDF